MEKITVEQLQNRFDEIMEKVESEKKSYYIIGEDGKDCVMIPYEDYEYFKQYFEHNEAP